MKSFIMQPGFIRSMQKVGKKDYKDIEKDLSKLDNGMKTLLTEEQRKKYNLKI
jgi:hypothetical protein